MENLFATKSSGGQSISWKDAPKGTKYVIEVTENPELVDGEDYNGKPQKSVVVNGLVDGEERTLWAPVGKTLAFAISKAQEEAGDVVRAGGTLTVWTEGLVPSPKKAGVKFRAFGASYQPGGAKDAFAAPAAASQRTNDEPPF